MFYLSFIQASLSTNNHQIRNLKLLPIPLDERDPNINKIILKDREHVKIRNQEQTSIMPSIVIIEIISMHETTPGTSLFKLLLDEINFIQTPQGLIGYGMVFITIVVIQKDQSIIALIKNIPQNIKANKLVPKNKLE